MRFTPPSASLTRKASPSSDADAKGPSMRRFALLTVAVALVPPLTAQEQPLPRGAIVRLGSNQLRQGSLVTALQFAPNGKVLLSSGVDGSLRFWDPSSGRLLASVENRPEC